MNSPADAKISARVWRIISSQTASVSPCAVILSEIVAALTVIPTRGNRDREIISPKRASMSLSPVPKHLMTAFLITNRPPPIWSMIRGATVAVNISIISAGTPGSAKIREARRPSKVAVTSTPGAVPRGL